MKSTSEVTAYLVRLGTFPSGLDVRIQSGDVLREQGRCKKSRVLLELLSNCKIQNLKVISSETARDECASLILKTVFHKPQPLLQRLTLLNVSSTSLSSILSNAEDQIGLKELGFSGLKELTVCIHQEQNDRIGRILALIIMNQAALESVTVTTDLVSNAFPSDSGVEFVTSALCNLVVQPQFSNLTLVGFKDVPLEFIKSIIKDFNSCSSRPVNCQQLMFNCLAIRDKKHFDGSSSIRKLISTYMGCGFPKKRVSLISATVPFAFFDWLTSLKWGFHTSLEVSFCKLEIHQVGEIHRIEEYFQYHPHFVFKDC